MAAEHITWFGETLFRNHRAIGHMLSQEERDRSKREWDLMIVTDLLGGGLDFMFLEHTEIRLTENGNLGIDKHLFHAEDGMQPMLDARESELEKALDYLAKKYGSEFVGRLNFKVVSEKVREAKFGGRPATKGI